MFKLNVFNKKEYERAYYLTHKAEWEHYNKTYRQKHREQQKQYAREYRKNNKDKLIIQRKENYTKLKTLVFQILGGAKCVRCGFTDVRALQLDHINGDGKKEGRRFPGSSMYKRYAKRPSLARLTLQVLCANCNWIKRFENNENGRNQVVI